MPPLSRIVHVIAFCSIAFASGCTSVMYGGPRRPKSEVAVIKCAPGTTIVNLDRRPAEGGESAKYEVLPGDHIMSVVAQGRVRHALYTSSITSPASRFCLTTRAGHVYQIERPLNQESGQWGLVITDVGTGTAVEPDCPMSRSAAPLTAQAPASASAPSSLAAPAPDGAPATASAPVAAATSSAEDVPSAASPFVPASQARRPAASAPPSAPAIVDQPPPLPRPGTGIQLLVTAAYGGDALVEAKLSDGGSRTLKAGTGIQLGVGGMLTPFWLRDTVGFGAAAEIGWKYDGIDASNASISLSRFPLTLSLHTFIPLSETWFVRLAGGGHKDLSPSLSSDGDASGLGVDFSCPWGWMGELGFYNVYSWHFGVGFNLRYTSIHYAVGPNSVDASHVGANLVFHLNR